jgi:hypothetical protein
MFEIVVINYAVRGLAISFDCNYPLKGFVFKRIFEKKNIINE